MNHNIRILCVIVFLFITAITPAIASAGSIAPVSEEKIQSGDVTLHLRVAGDPASSLILIAINGGPGMSSHYMQSLEQLAGPDLSVVTFDQRGTGRSSESAEGYSLEKHAADIEKIRRHLKAEKFYVFGHSFGGIIAQRYASIHTERVSGLILMGSGPPDFSSVSAAQNEFNQHVGQLIQEGVISGPQPSDPAKILEYMLPAYFSDPEFPIPKELKESSLHLAVGQQTYSDSGEWDFREELKVITCPVLFIWGENDPFRKGLAGATEKALINARVTSVTLDKCGHYWHENSEDFFMQIKNFLAPASQDEVSAVIERSYFNGAFNDLDTESMRRGFHPDFAIFSPSGTEISRYPIDVWIKGIEKRKTNSNFDPSKARMNCKIVRLDMTGNCAAAKVEIASSGKLLYTDYLSLLKFDDGWKIVAKVYHQHTN